MIVVLTHLFKLLSFFPLIYSKIDSLFATTTTYCIVSRCRLVLLCKPLCVQYDTIILRAVKSLTKNELKINKRIWICNPWSIVYTIVWSHDRLNMAVVHLPAKSGANIFIQSGHIDIFRKSVCRPPSYLTFAVSELGTSRHVGGLVLELRVTFGSVHLIIPQIPTFVRWQ